MPLKRMANPLDVAEAKNIRDGAQEEVAKRACGECGREPPSTQPEWNAKPRILSS